MIDASTYNIRVLVVYNFPKLFKFLKFFSNKICFCDDCDCRSHEMFVDDEGFVVLYWGKTKTGKHRKVRFTKEQLVSIVAAGNELLRQFKEEKIKNKANI